MTSSSHTLSSLLFLKRQFRASAMASLSHFMAVSKFLQVGQGGMILMRFNFFKITRLDGKGWSFGWQIFIYSGIISL